MSETTHTVQRSLFPAGDYEVRLGFFKMYKKQPKKLPGIESPERKSDTFEMELNFRILNRLHIDSVTGEITKESLAGEQPTQRRSWVQFTPATMKWVPSMVAQLGTTLKELKAAQLAANAAYTGQHKQQDAIPCLLLDGRVVRARCQHKDKITNPGQQQEQWDIWHPDMPAGPAERKSLSTDDLAVLDALFESATTRTPVHTQLADMNFDNESKELAPTGNDVAF